MIMGVALAIAVTQLVYNIGVGFGAWQPLTRPSRVPRSAHFVSTLKDETWFDCRVDEGRGVDVCRAWDEKGRVVADGDFRLEDEDRAATASELRPSEVKTQNGQVYMIYLYGPHGEVLGRTLLPVINGRRVGVPKVTTNP